jgi:hypothetical protein
MVDDDLSDEQLQQLLKDAEQRLRSKSKKQNQISEISALSNRYAPSSHLARLIKDSLTNSGLQLTSDFI